MKNQQNWLQLILCGFITVASTPANAQITPDNTLGAESSRLTPNVQINGASADRIDGGAARGSNLFQLADFLLLRRGSQISTTAGTAQAGGDGGKITIDTPFIVSLLLENNDITANAFSGKAGNVNINAQSLFGIEARSPLTAFSTPELLPTQNPIIEAQRWVKTPDGKVMLVAQVPTATPNATTASAAYPVSQ